PLLRPGIRVEDVVHAHRGGGNGPSDELARIDPHEAHVRDPALDRALLGDAQVLVRPLDAEHGDLRMSGGGSEQEAPFSDPDLDLDGTRRTEDLLPGEAMESPVRIEPRGRGR